MMMMSSPYVHGLPHWVSVFAHDMRRESGFFQLEIGIVSKITWLQPGLRIEMSWEEEEEEEESCPLCGWVGEIVDPVHSTLDAHPLAPLCGIVHWTQ